MKKSAAKPYTTSIHTHRSRFQLFMVGLFIVACFIALTSLFYTSKVAIQKTVENRAAAAGATKCMLSKLARHRIGTRVDASGDGYFYDTITGAKFTPRGANLLQFTDPTVARAELPLMRAKGYNTVRILIDQGQVGNPSGTGLSDDYMSKVAAFLQTAKSNNLQVLITLSFIPDKGGYHFVLPNPNIESTNNFYLTQEGITAKTRYVTDFISQLACRNVSVDTILGYSLENEQLFEGNSKPFSMSSGTVRTGNGGTYDMSSEASRAQMMDANLVYWMNSIRTGIRAADPTALVTVGFYTPDFYKAPPQRYLVRPYWIIADSAQGGSQADFIDLHAYAGSVTPMRQDNLDAFQISSKKKPLLMGETGAYPYFSPDISQAAREIKALQIRSCPKGFDGWLMWSWNNGTDVGTNWYSAKDGNNAIGNILSPQNRPDPCR